jgi:CIC family chloride channel protein
MGGTAFGLALGALFPTLHLSAGAFGLVGMAAVFAGAAHAPITAVLIVFELTGDYAIILPLMFAVSLATGVSHLISRHNIYTLKLLRRGVNIDDDSPIDERLRLVTVGELMQPVTESSDSLPRGEDGPTPGQNGDGGDRRVVAPRGETLAARDGEAAPRPDARTATRVDGAQRSPSPTQSEAPALHPDTTAFDALEVFATHRGAALPVRDGTQDALIGRLTEHEVLEHLRRARDD